MLAINESLDLLAQKIERAVSVSRFDFSFLGHPSKHLLWDVQHVHGFVQVHFVSSVAHAVFLRSLAMVMACSIGVAALGQASKYGTPSFAAHCFSSSVRSPCGRSGFLWRISAAASARRPTTAKRCCCGVAAVFPWPLPFPSQGF